VNDITCVELKKLFVSLGDKTRLQLVSLMSDGPICVCHLVDAIGESQPKISRHLAYLRNAGLVVTRRKGKSISYALAEPALEGIRQVLSTVLACMKGTDSLLQPPTPVHRSSDSIKNIYGNPYINEYESVGCDHQPWTTEELEIHLL